MPCAQKGLAQPEPVRSWLPGPACGDCHSVSWQCQWGPFLHICPLPPRTVLPQAALRELFCRGCAVGSLGCIHPALSPCTYLSCSNPISRAIAVWLHPGASILWRLLCPVLFGQPWKVPGEAHQMVWCEWQESVSHCQIAIFNIIFTVEFRCKERL